MKKRTVASKIKRPETLRQAYDKKRYWGVGIESKRCVHCDAVKPKQEFWRHHGNIDGLQSWCKHCILSRAKSSVLLSHGVAVGNGKICRKCKTEKDLSLFYKLESSPDGRQAYCKSCANDHVYELKGYTKDVEGFWISRDGTRRRKAFITEGTQ